MQTDRLIERIYANVEDGAIDKAVFACVRLARDIGDLFNLVIFIRELSADKKQFASTFGDETRSLNDDACKFLWETSHDHWVAERTLDHPLGGEDDDKKRNILILGVGELQRELEHFEQCIKDMEVPVGMGEFDTAAFTDRYVERKRLYRQRIRANQTVIERIRTRCLNYASRVEKQLAAQAGNINFLSEVQSSVNNFFSVRCEDVYTKLMKATELARSTQPEDQALLLTAVRRAIKAVADHFYPPGDEEVTCEDGKRRRMSNEQYLNRLEEFCKGLLTPSTADGMLKEELRYLSAFMRRLTDVASKGVHADVSSREAKQGLIGMYMFLSNLISRIETNKSNQASEVPSEPAPSAASSAPQGCR